MDLTNEIRRKKISDFLSDKLVRLFMILTVIICVFPFIYMLIISFMNTNSMKLTWDAILHADWTAEHYKSLFTGNGKWLHYLLNSTIITLYACVVTLVLSAMAAYAFEKLRFAGRDMIYKSYVMTMMVSFYAIMIAVYMIVRKLGLLNTYTGMVLPTFSAYGVIMLRAFVKGIPNELLEAASIDGCSEARRFVSIVLPLMKPALISLAIHTFFSTWGNFLWPMIVNTGDKITAVQALASYNNTIDVVNYGKAMAACTVVFLPPFILYLVLQKQFVEGIAVSGIKG